ncbi:diguanylate cyclase [Pseudomonas sp. N40(2020)]|uniref:diguanylate cyclase domain-containing protein n=1 Tax=Pseudomonas sp. N40(2020) TaxID=2767798 RepID=UPI00165757FB|nr:diguanylate cyclase [Pseudomonas sp. N40(2020)]MBC8994941.1 diguanylate cyclase [Pseudomonas sp. N40(2020)]
MNRKTENDKKALAAASIELTQVVQKTQEARIKLDDLEQKVANTQFQVLENQQSGQLIEANEQLVLALLQAQIGVEQAATALREVSHAAQLDVLTGLPNRRLLLGRLAQAIKDTTPEGEGLAVLFLDLNHFKLINDTLGHSVGDEVLKETALRLSGAVRKNDTVGRYGGDEFIILLEGTISHADVLGICDKIIKALGVPHPIGNQVLQLAASIGVSYYPKDGDDPHTLIDCADAAMYRAKRHSLGVAFHSTVLLPVPLPTHLPIIQAQKKSGAHQYIAHGEHERRRAHLREANEQLVLTALNAQQLQAAAEDALDKQKKILAMVAHELRNPLTPLTQVAGMLMHSSHERLASIQAIIERQTSHIARLVDDLMDISMVQTGKLRLNFQPVDIATIIDEAVIVCRPAIDLRFQQFVVRQPGRSLMINGDHLRLTQILCNLLGNASKYTPNNGSIELAIGTSSDDITLTFSDTGIGISAEVLDFIFDPFVQDAHAIGYNGAGLGVGLSVVRELVEGHRGSVSVSSGGLGLGSKFVVTLPLHPQSQ